MPVDLDLTAEDDRSAEDDSLGISDVTAQEIVHMLPLLLAPHCYS